ncbi:hypothetical protein [Anaerococcus sp. Marseille-P3625]|uniref:hypothetical protein n=1 Tax=Anaerococcus sp. Marseille-P3625 TaxID=1977277 RepID=UPI000C06BDF0|nr:hypothetical protein [Anaerococcus sp. Marseille-P3625]
MKTKEFIKRVEELGLDVDIKNGYINIDGDYFNGCYISIDEPFTINTDFGGVKKPLFDLLVEYASTPPEDREEEKKFYLKHRWMAYENENNLTLCFPTGKYYLSHSTENNGYKTTFTLKEIEEIKKKFDTDLADFELVEVEE